MDQIKLPILKSDANLVDAIEAIKQQQCSGVFVGLDAGPRVIDVDIILYTLRNAGNLKIGEVEPREITIDLGNQVSAAAVMSSVDAMGSLLDRMDKARAAYALAGVEGGLAVIFTRHEIYRDLAGRQTSMRRCRKDPNHVWSAGELRQPGNLCRNDGSNTDLV